MQIDGLEVDSLVKAYKKYEEFRKHLATEQEQAGAIQAFEYTFELTWKIMKRLLAQKGVIVNSPKETIRAAALEQFINDPELWFSFLKTRNITVHTYEEEVIDHVISIFDSFSQEMRLFLQKIGIPL